MESTRFICKCGLSDAWIHDGLITESCPKCGRKYRGEEKRNKKTGFTEINAIEITPPKKER